MTPERAEAARLWRRYADHAAVLFRSGPRPTMEFTDQWFVVASGAQHVDMNQGALYGEATAEDAERLASRVLAAEVPCLLGCSDGVQERVAGTLRAAGFEQLPNREAMFRRPGLPEVPEPSPFEVRRVRSRDDFAAMQSIFLEAHGYSPESIERIYGGRVTGDDGFSAWLAWDGGEPVSFTIVIEVGPSLSIWEVMTPPRHRRRGAARAVVAGALASVANSATQQIEETLFWASPAGRPLYERMGFVVADEVDAWTIGASPEDLAAVGA
ncbi:MAG TPA: GNAT family N-acetyltransferase [Candidatus Limnocylindria bacterium]|nr:GNAT family N-acetyltransferase [Candidatus Limnocylindria bacterium]